MTTPRNEMKPLGGNREASRSRGKFVHPQPTRMPSAPASPPTILHADFEHARNAMLREFDLLLAGGVVSGLSDAVEIVGATQNTMLQMATQRCRLP